MDACRSNTLTYPLCFRYENNESEAHKYDNDNFNMYNFILSLVALGGSGDLVAIFVSVGLTCMITWSEFWCGVHIVTSWNDKLNLGK